MSDSREYWSFLVPWTGGLVASWGDISPLGIGWAALVLTVAVVVHNRVSKAPSQPQEHRKANDA
jgi:hypothetical protein